MSNLNTPAIYNGPLTADDLADWREPATLSDDDIEARYRIAQGCIDVGCTADPQATATFWAVYAVFVAVGIGSAVAYFI